MKTSRKIITQILCITMLVSMLTPMAYAQTPEYATREYIVSEFVQSIGRNSIESSDAVLEIFKDSNEISYQYKDDISRAIVAGILKGYDDLTIRPTEPVRRIEAMTMLARCVPELSAYGEEITFTDVPRWAAEDMAYLSKAGLVKGYGDGRMGADDHITIEQVKLLVERSDEALRTVRPGDSFYGYVNEKTFRNVVLENATRIDPLHGAVVTKNNSWSQFDDISAGITQKEEEILEKLMGGEFQLEDGSTEQRIHDMLECIASDEALSDSDKENISSMRRAIMDAQDTEALLEVAKDIYNLAGINILFDISIGTDKETGIAYPMFSISGVGDGGFLAFRESTDTDEYRDIYGDLLFDYLNEIGADFTEEDIDNAILFQEKSSLDNDYYTITVALLNFAKAFGIIDDAKINEEIESMKKLHPELYDEKNETFLNPAIFFESYDREKADATFNGFDLCQELTDYGFTNLEKIIVPTGEIAKAEKNLICDENLDSLKINALIRLGMSLNISLTEKENKYWSRVMNFSLTVCLASDAKDLRSSYEEDDADNSQAQSTLEQSAGMEYDEGVLNVVNLNKLRTLMPDDIGLLYCKYYYDDQISDVIAQMFYDIWDAYEARFEANTWMKEETRKNAIKKLDNMIAIIAYPDNYTFPDIVPMSEGGTLFSNTLNITRHNLSKLIRCNEDKEFIRTLMYMPPDTVNACYLPSYNTINVPAGILHEPMFDTDATYAQNLGSIGMVIAHEVGHAFDKMGAQYDENGCLKNWWTKEDYEEFQKLQEYFVEYYNQFELAEGVIQDAEITITENMADFAAMQILMDILGDDKQAQKECLESYAKMWARLGTISYLTTSTLMNDVHAANVVRVNAVVASFDQFYEIYNISEGDPMYVPPEKRLKLW